MIAIIAQYTASKAERAPERAPWPNFAVNCHHLAMDLFRQRHPNGFYADLAGFNLRVGGRPSTIFANADARPSRSPLATSIRSCSRTGSTASIGPPRSGEMLGFNKVARYPGVVMPSQVIDLIVSSAVAAGIKLCGVAPQ